MNQIWMRNNYNLLDLTEEVNSALEKIGICAEKRGPSYLQKKLTEIFSISASEFEEMARTNTQFYNFLADLVLDKWLEEDTSEITLLEKNFFNDSGDISSPVFYSMVSGRRVPNNFGYILLFEEQPLYVHFSKNPAFWETEAIGAKGGAFFSRLKEKIDEYVAKNLKGRVLDIDLKECSLKFYDRQELIYPEGLSQEVDEMVTAFRSWNISDRIKRWGYLLVGSTGTGKTSIGGMLAKIRQEGTTYFYCPAGEFSNTQRLENIFHWANVLSPSVIQIDDVDLIAPDRSEKSQFTSTLMELLDGLGVAGKIFILLSTNDPSGIEEAIADRPGRISNKMVFEGFSKCMARLLERYCKQFELQVNQADLEQAVVECQNEITNFTPDDAKNVCERLFLLFGEERISVQDVAKSIRQTLKAFHDPALDKSYLHKKINPEMDQPLPFPGH